MDCLTTVVGTVFFGTQELNPLIAHLVETNLAVFVGVKLAATVAVGVIFVLAERMLTQNQNKHDQSLKFASSLRGHHWFSVCGCSQQYFGAAPCDITIFSGEYTEALSGKSSIRR